jgi:hypothetical protein
VDHGLSDCRARVLEQPKRLALRLLALHERQADSQTNRSVCSQGSSFQPSSGK